MVTTINKIGDTTHEPTINNDGFEVELNYDADDPDAVQVQVTNSHEFSVIAATVINDYIAQGLQGGNGIFEGLKYTVDIQDDNGTERILNHYLDLANPGNLFECDRVSVTSVQAGSVDWLNDRADSVMYELLLGTRFTTADYVQIPYVINSIPNYRETAIAILTAHSVITILRNIHKEILKVIAEISSVISAIAGVLKAVILVVWIILMFLIIVDLILSIKNTLIQNIKYVAGMRWQTLLEAGARELGLNFESDLFDEAIYRDTIIIPAKLQSLTDDSNPEERGFSTPSTDSNGYYDGSFRELLALSKDIINGKLITNSENNNLRLERVDYNDSQANYVLPDIELREYSYNANEINSSYTIEFQEDLSDENTIDGYSGTKSTIVTQPKTVTNKDMVLMRGDKKVSIPLALIKRKESLTPVEERFSRMFTNHTKLVNVIAIVMNVVIRVRNAIVKKIAKIIKGLKIIGIKIQFKGEPIPLIPPVSSDTIEQRIGMMMLSADYFQTPKIGTFDISSNPRQTKVKTNNSEVWSADALYSNFHFVNSFVPQAGNRKGNQWLRYETEVPFCKEDFLKVKNNNLIFDANGNLGKIESLLWNVYGERARINFRIQQTYTKNLEEKQVKPNGF